MDRIPLRSRFTTPTKISVCWEKQSKLSRGQDLARRPIHVIWAKSVSLNYSSALPMKHHDQCHRDEVSPSIKAELNPHCCLIGDTSRPWHSQPEPRQEPAEPPFCRLQSLAPLSGARAAPPAPPGLASTASCPPTRIATFCGATGGGLPLTAASDAATTHGETLSLAGLPAAPSWRILSRGSCSPWKQAAVPGQRLARGGCRTEAAVWAATHPTARWALHHGSCLHALRLLRGKSTVETQVSCLPWYSPDLQHHGLAHSSNTDAPKAKGLPALSPYLCTATASTWALLLTYLLAFPARRLRRMPWHCWPRQLASPGAQQYNRQQLQVLGHSKYALENQPGIGEASFTSNTSSFRSEEGRDPFPRSATVTPLNI